MTPLSARSTVCAVVPHYRCEEWLTQAIEALLDQTRPLDAIVVADDGSGEPPVDLVAAHPEVTLVEATDNGGPYRLVQAVIDATDFDAYLFQDADDWSTGDRLEALLAEAEASGAELVGSHEVRVLVDEGDVVPVRYPLDVNAALRERPTSFPLLHPTSIVSRALVRRLGGFATAMRFSGDAELLRRAAHAARVVNTDQFLYFRRKRQGSLTLGSDTALGSPARQAVQDVLAERALGNAAAVRVGRLPDLAPWRVADGIELRHCRGPRLGERRRVHAVDRRPPRAGGGPVFVVGAPRAGHTVLAWALGQHPSFALQPDSRWLARLAMDVEARVGGEAVPAPAGVRSAMADTLSRLAATGGRRLLASGAELVPAVHALHQLFPDARFVHVTRDVDDAVAAVTAAPTTDGTFYTEESAWRAWLVANEALLAAEEALGSDVVLRIAWRDLVDDADAALRRCLRFVDETDAPACARPLRGLGASRTIDLDAQDPPFAARARALSREANAAQPVRGADAAARRVLAERFHRERSSGRVSGGSLVERVHGLVAESVPEGSTVAVVSRGDPRLVDLPGRRGWHVPQVDGVYAGHHPRDSGDAVAAVEAVRARGAEFLVVPASGLWWLSFYEGLRRHVAADATLVAFHEEAGAVFRFGRSPASRDDGPAAPRFEPVSTLDTEEEVRSR